MANNDKIKPVLLIIGVLFVLFCLYALTNIGSFSVPGPSGIKCVASPYYSCSNVTLSSSNGTLSFILKQNTGTTIYNVALACAAAANISTGYPNVSTTNNPSVTGFYAIYTNGNVNSIGGGGGTQFSTNQSLKVLGLPCYGNNGLLLGSKPAGTWFSGGIWLNYTNAPGIPSVTNQWNTKKIISVLSIKTT